MSSPMGTEEPVIVETVSVSSFILKLWNLLSQGYECIFWSEHGYSFQIRKIHKFSKEILPLYFKHSNMNSFVRQLNMYGFRKVSNVHQSGLKNPGNEEVIEFQHSHFIKDHPELLSEIKRKVTNTPGPPSSSTARQSSLKEDPETAEAALKDLKQLHARQNLMESKLSHVMNENEMLWKELGDLRVLHEKQRQILKRNCAVVDGNSESGCNDTEALLKNRAILYNPPSSGVNDLTSIANYQEDTARVKTPLKAIWLSSNKAPVSGISKGSRITVVPSKRRLNEPKTPFIISNGKSITTSIDEQRIDTNTNLQPSILISENTNLQNGTNSLSGNSNSPLGSTIPYTVQEPSPNMVAAEEEVASSNHPGEAQGPPILAEAEPSLNDVIGDGHFLDLDGPLTQQSVLDYTDLMQSDLDTLNELIFGGPGALPSGPLRTPEIDPKSFEDPLNGKGKRKKRTRGCQGCHKGKRYKFMSRLKKFSDYMLRVQILNFQARLLIQPFCECGISI